MKTITQTYAMKATPQQVFAALTNPEMIKQWSGAPAEMDAAVGAKFSLFGGAIHGSNLEVVPHQKLIQAWYAGNWERPSTAIFTLTPTAEGTLVELLHEGVPDGAQAQISEGWSTSYLGPMQTMFAAQQG